MDILYIIYIFIQYLYPRIRGQPTSFKLKENLNQNKIQRSHTQTKQEQENVNKVHRLKQCHCHSSSKLGVYCGCCS